MENKTKIQHYVPRFYLKNFSITKEKPYLLHCFDKYASKTFVTDIRKIGCEKYFYEFSNETTNLLEKDLSLLESKFNIAYNKILHNKDLLSLTESERRDFAHFIAVQLLRTNEKRESLKDLMKQLTEKLSKQKLSEEFEIELKEANTNESLKNLHLNTLLDTEPYINIILNMKWVLFINKTTMPYWTSDNPINLYNDLDLRPYGNLGLASRGIQVYFPLNPLISICLCDPVRYNILPDKDETIDIQNIIFQNHLQVKWSTRHIFSINSDFSLAEKIIKDLPELKEIHRKRFSIN